MLEELENPANFPNTPLRFQNASFPLLSLPGDEFLSLVFFPLSYNDEVDRLDSETIPISSMAWLSVPP